MFESVKNMNRSGIVLKEEIYNLKFIIPLPKLAKVFLPTYLQHFLHANTLYIYRVLSCAPSC
jgi:hypothetical protein